MTGVAMHIAQGDRRRLRDIEPAEKRLERGRCPCVSRGTFRLKTSPYDQRKRARNIEDILRSGSRRAKRRSWVARGGVIQWG
jgi:hypothetical protein